MSRRRWLVAEIRLTEELDVLRDERRAGRVVDIAVAAVDAPASVVVSERVNV